MNKSLTLLVVLTVLLAGTEHVMHSPGPSRALGQDVLGQDRGFERDTTTLGDTTTGRADEEDRAKERAAQLAQVRARELQAMLERVWPEHRIEIILLPQGVVLKGTVRWEHLNAMTQIAQQFFPNVVSLIATDMDRGASPPAPAFDPRANTPNGKWAAPEGLRPPLQPSNPTPYAPTLPLPPPSMPPGVSGPPGQVPVLPPGYGAPPGTPTPGTMPGMPAMPGMGPGHDMGRELTELREEIQQLRQEVRELKDLLRQRPELRATAPTFEPETQPTPVRPELPASGTRPTEPSRKP